MTSNEPTLPLPPPIVETIEALNPTNEGLPGDIVLTSSGQLMKRFLTYQGVLADTIEAFNAWTAPNGRILEQLQARPLILADGRILWPVRYRTVEPNLTPLQCRDREATYARRLIVDFQLPNPDTGFLEERSHEIGSLPIMLRSHWDILGDNDQDREAAGECSGDPGGYFIVHGLERVVLIQERLRLNRILIFYNNTKQGVICRITTSTKQSTTIVTLVQESRAIRLRLAMMEANDSLPVFLAFRLLAQENPSLPYTDLDSIMKVVMNFVDPRFRQRVWFYLDPTRQEYNAAGDVVDLLVKILKYRPRDPTEARAVALERFNNELFTHMLEEPVQMRAYLLALMTARYAEYLAGVRNIDDWDSWSNKRLGSAARSMEQLFDSSWRNTIRNARDSIRQLSSARPLSIDVVLSKLKGNLTRDFIKSMKTPNWGVAGGSNNFKENISDMLKRETVTATLAHLTRINTPANRRVRNDAIRRIQFSQLGYVDPVETPEGAAIGLVKAKAITCMVSVERNEDFVRAHLDDLWSAPTETASAVVLLNGKFIGWTDAATTARTLINLKRQLALPRDVSILHRENILYLHTDGERPTRPLLLVDEESQELVIDRKHLWDQPFDDLLREGAVEYVDAFEQEWIDLATSIDDLRLRNTTLREARQRLRELEHQLEVLQEAVNPDAPTPLIDLLPQIVYRVPTGGLSLIADEAGEAVNRTFLSDEEIENIYRLTVADYQRQIDQAQQRVTQLSRRRYTHCEMDPSAILGIAASLLPLPEHTQGPRNVYASGFAKTAIGYYHSNHQLRFDSTAKLLAYPTRPIMETQIYRLLGLHMMPTGQSITLAIMPYFGFNQEDSIILNRGSVDRGLFWYVWYATYTTVELRSGAIVDRITRPPLRKDEDPTRYQNLDDNGIARLGSIVKEGDVLIGKVRFNKDTQTTEVANITVGVGEEGIVDRILITTNSDGLRVVKVKLRDVRRPQMGDKFCLTSDHEVLTERGWLPIANVTLDDRVAALRPDGSFDYETPRGIYGFDHEGPIVEVETSNVSLRVTLDHHMWVRRPDRDHFERIRARHLTGPVYYQKTATSHRTGRIEGIVNESGPLPSWVWDLEAGEARRLLDQLLTKSDRWDEIQRLALHAGQAWNLNTGFTLAESQATRTITSYRGPVYCLEVPSHVFYVRRKGIPVWTGNSTTSGQKGTVAIIIPEEDMPFTSQGVRPDVIMNPLAVPSRMTIGQLIEQVTSKVGALRGERINGTLFGHLGGKGLDEFRRNLVQYGYQSYGYETMYMGTSGRRLSAQIFIGPCYYLALRHNVKDKIQARDRGAIRSDTHQPVAGRARRGGLRWGEMERDNLISYGASGMVMERLMISSDLYRPVFCSTCGTIAISDVQNRQYICRCCGPNAVFGVCDIPYAFKLLTQLLAGAGINIRLGLKQLQELKPAETP